MGNGQETGEDGARFFRFSIGAIEAAVVSDGTLPPDKPQTLFPDVPSEVLTDVLARHRMPTDHLDIEQNCLVIRSGGKVILFDTGVGTDKTFGTRYSGRLPDSLMAAGFDPRDVSAVVLTHAHCDHCWGMVDDHGTRNFPNAEVYLAQAEWDFWTDEEKQSDPTHIGAFVRGARRNLLPYADRMTFIRGDAEILPGIFAVASPGHSVGHTSFIVSSEGDDRLILGDVAHSTALSFAGPDWRFAYDFDPVLASRTRRGLFERAAADGLSLLGYHFGFPGLGGVRRKGDAFEYLPGT